MTEIEREIARIQAENDKLRGKSKPPSKALDESWSVLYRMTAKHSGFAAFCRPRLGSSIKPMAEIIAGYRKSRAAELRNFMKPRGINSILKGGPYWTGRLLRTDAGEFVEELKLKRVNRDEWTSEDPWEGESISQEVPAFGQDRVKPTEIEEEEPETLQEPAQDEAGGLQTDANGEVGVTALIEALEAQNALLRSLGVRRAA